MAQERISEMPALSTALAAGDLLVIVDVSDTTDAASGTTKKITQTNFWANITADITTTGTLVAGAANINGALVVSLDSGATNSVTDVADFTSTSTGVPANGIGVGITFNTETAAGNTEIGGAIRSIATDVDPTNEDFDMVFYTMLSGDLATEVLRLHDDNSATFAGTLACAGFTSTGIDDNATSVAITIDSAERALFGHTTSSVLGVGNGAGGNTNTGLAVFADGSNGSIGIGRWTNDAVAARLLVGKSRNTTVGGDTILVDNDAVFDIVANADDGTNQTTSIGMIRFEVDDANPIANSIGGAIQVLVGKGLGADDLTETLYLAADLSATFAGTLIANGAAAVVSGARDAPEGALADLLVELDTIGLIDNQTTAS